MSDAAKELEKLRTRIKNTSSTRFSASHRVHFNYTLAKLTVVILSLWAIFISYVLTSELGLSLHYDVEGAEAAGIILPVFVVVFSLIEGGETYLRAHNLELNARQLRELADKLKGETINGAAESGAFAILFEKYSREYNDILERSPINHRDIDHWSKYYVRCRQSVVWFSRHWWYFFAITMLLWFRRQMQRFLYLSLWVIPAFLFDFRCAIHNFWNASACGQ